MRICGNLRTALFPQAIQGKLQSVRSHKVQFFSFCQDNDSVLNSEEGRQKLRDVGIGTPLEVGEWLVEVFRKDFGQDQLADQLDGFIHTPYTRRI